MAFTALPIPTATILQHPTVTSLVSATSYVLVQKATGATEKISLASLILLVGGIPKFDDVEAVEAATIGAESFILMEDANGSSGLFVLSESVGPADGVNSLEDATGTIFERVQLT